MTLLATYSSSQETCAKAFEFQNTARALRLEFSGDEAMPMMTAILMAFKFFNTFRLHSGARAPRRKRWGIERKQGDACRINTCRDFNDDICRFGARRYISVFAFISDISARMIITLVFTFKMLFI